MRKLKCILLFFLLQYSSHLSGQTLEIAYQLASNNKENLQAVLRHYKNSGETEKFEAASFLIKNMSIHKSSNFNWVDVSGKIIHFSEKEYADFGADLGVFEKLKDSIQLRPKTYIQKDVSVITANFLIKNVDLAFYEWKNNPWSASYSFETFCEYILPYRSLIEPLEDWREDYRFLVENAISKVEDINDPTDVATQVILELKDFSFISKRPDPIPLLSPSQLLFRRQGSCPDLANLALLACRSLGLAVTFDFTPHYAASSNRHFFNTIINSEGDHIPFNGNSVATLDGLPYAYSPNNKRMGKVFRKTYSIQHHSLASIVSKKEIPKGFLQEQNIKDVTHEYVNVGRLIYMPDAALVKDIEITYLNVFNTGRWKAIDWAKKQKDSFVFNNMGVDLVYLPSTFDGQKMTFSAFPILLDKEGETHTLKPNFQDLVTTVLSRKNEFKTDYKENNGLEIEVGNKYQLYYWDSHWQKFGISQATQEGVLFKNLPKNALFRLISKKHSGYERIFILDAKTKRIRWY